MDRIQMPPSIDDSQNEEPQVDIQPEPPVEPEPRYVYYEPQYVPEVSKSDPFANLDKTAYIIIFISFILGFFMGKTMQPVILRHG